MKPLFLVSASALALAGLAACTSDKPPPARAALDCPQVQGDLTRTAVAADRKSCTYRTANGGEVILQLVATGGDPTAALRNIENDLTGPVAEAAKADAEAAAAKGSDAAGKASQAAAIASDAASDAARAAQEATQDAASAATAASDAAARADDKVSVHVPGVHVEAIESDKGDTAHINVPGIQIIADDTNDTADIRIGGLRIQKHDDEATIRIYRDVRLKGESLSRQRRGLRATFIYTGKNLPQGYRMVGYEAAGPKAGPLTVAVVKANAGDDMHDGGVYKDVKRLVRRNAGA